jgi:hypothetical protein
MVLKLAASISLLIQLVTLDHRTHRSVENDDTFFHQLLELLGMVWKLAHARIWIETKIYSKRRRNKQTIAIS